MTPINIGKFEIQGEIGRGGMAVVYKALDPYIKREVAIKVLPVEFMNQNMYRVRFEREIRTIARLEHPAIVPIYDAGQSEDSLYIIMKLMEGGSLAERISQKPLELPELKKVMHRVCWALDDAHTQQIVHRDIKPDNILLDRWGDAFLSDFGITKVSDANQSLTRTNQPIGTPYYMSPEQVDGQYAIDGRSDIYSLGVLLFQLLTNKLPYTGKTPMSIAYAHVNQEIPRVREFRPELPPAFDDIVSTAMAKNPADRYAKASDLYDALANIRNNSVPLGSVGSPDAQELYSNTLVSADTNLYDFSVKAIDSYNITEKNRVTCSPVRNLAMVAGTDIALAADNSVWLCDLNNPHQLNVLGSHKGFVWGMSWHPNGQYLASGGQDETIRIWSLLSQTEQQTLTEHNSWIWELAWSPDGAKLASGGDDGMVCIWNCQTWSLEQKLPAHNGAVTALAWTSDSNHLASGGDDGRINVWQVSQHEPLYSLTDHIDRVRCLSWSSNGQWLASGGSDSIIRVWDGERNIKNLKGHEGWVERLIWKEDDSLLVSAGSYGDTAIYFWDINRSSPIKKLTDHTRPIFGLTWLTNSPELLSGSDDGTIRVWNVVE